MLFRKAARTANPLQTFDYFGVRWGFSDLLLTPEIPCEVGEDSGEEVTLDLPPQSGPP